MLALSGALSMAAPQGTAFTYQGNLTSGGAPANGNYDMWFKLYTDPSAGTQIGPTVTTNAMPVSNGLFTVSLDFGAFTGQAGWLDIWVHNSTNDPAADWVWLSPRQQVTPAPCATYSANAGVAVTASNVVAGGISGPSIAAGQVVKSLNGLHDDLTLAPGSGVTITPSGNTLQISATGVSGGGWSLSGNSVAPGQFLGSLNNQPLEFWANGARALRIEPTLFSPNLVGGCRSNSVSSGATGATVAGGGTDGWPNKADDSGFVGGGYGNGAGQSAVVAGGGLNSASGPYSVVGGGWENYASGAYSVVGGGWENSASVTNSVVIGGSGNSAGGVGAAVLGGLNNSAMGEAATVPGGNGNQASGLNSFAAGTSALAGHDGAFVWGDATHAPVASTVPNQFLVQASGGVQFQSSTAPMLTVDSSGNLAANGQVGSMGGQLRLTASGIPVQRFQLRTNLRTGDTPNLIGGSFENWIAPTAYSSIIAGGGGQAVLGAGSLSNVVTGSWSTISGGAGNEIDSGFSSIGGGNNNWIAGQGATIPGGEYNEADGNSSFAAGYKAKAGHDGMFVWADSKNFDFRPESYGFYDNTFDVRATGGSLWITAVDSSGNGTTGPYFVPGDLGWRSSCDRNLKENFQPVDTQALLEKLCQLPITQWNAKAQSPDIRHVGPVAQDFHAAFSLGGKDDKSISSIDEAGVAFAAIQALNQKLDQTVKAKDAEIQALRQAVAELRETVGRLAPPAK